MMHRLAFYPWALAFCLLAQTPPSTMPSVVRAPNAVDISLIPSAPFTATAVLVTAPPPQSGPLPEPTNTFTILARDSQGRVYVEDHEPVAPSGPGQGPIRNITIYDPVARTTTELDPATMQATIFRLRIFANPTRPPNHSSILSEDSGVSTMQGLTVHAHRQSSVPGPSSGAPAFVEESWFSDQLQIDLMRKTERPNAPTRTVTLRQVRLKEPDPALFLIPAGYKQTDVHKAIRVSAEASEANLLARVKPQYPPLLKGVRIEGVVEFTITIAQDGTVKHAQLVRGHPLLVSVCKDSGDHSIPAIAVASDECVPCPETRVLRQIRSNSNPPTQIAAGSGVVNARVPSPVTCPLAFRVNVAIPMPLALSVSTCEKAAGLWITPHNHRRIQIGVDTKRHCMGSRAGKSEVQRPAANRAPTIHTGIRAFTQLARIASQRDLRIAGAIQ